MTRILKATIEFDAIGDNGEAIAELPYDAYFISALNQRGKLVVYAECPNKKNAMHPLLVLGTGHAGDLAGWRFLSTVSFDGGELILHVYARGK